MTPRVLVTGGTGRLGQALGQLGCTALGRANLDITDKASIDVAMARHAPDIVINAAAYTAVDASETDRAAATAINTDGAANMAAACAAHGAAVIQISTDCVYGDAPPNRPVREDAPYNALSHYGQTKADGDIAVLSQDGLAGRRLIARVSWLFDDSQTTFIGKMLNVAKGRDALSIVDDEFGRPTYVGDLAAALMTLATRMHAGEMLPDILHLGPANPVNRYDWAQHIFAASAAQSGPSPSLSPISADAFPTAARRPRGLVLDTARADALLGPMPDWKARSDAAVAAILAKR